MTPSTANSKTHRPFIRATTLGLALLIGAPSYAITEAEEAAAAAAARGNMAQLLGDEKDYPAGLRVFVTQDAQDGLRNRVLNDSLAGLAAFELSQPKIAQRLFADSRELIETIYADSPSAEEARSKFTPDATKDFKGDPYERAMVGYYLSLADFVGSADLDNSRADLKFAENQDTMSANEKYQSDMAIMPYIRGWLYNCSNQPTRAVDEFASVSKAKPKINIPARKNNVLLIAEVGVAPGKFSTGKYHEELRYKRMDDAAVRGVTFVNHKTLLVGQQIEDVYWQASTRGGSAVDNILAGKASFKQTSENISSGAAAVADVSNALSIGSTLSGDNRAAEQFGNLALFGSLLSIGSGLVANATKPEADTRAWTSLPDRIYVTTAFIEKLDGAQWSAGFHSVDGSLIKAVNMKTFTAGACMVAWSRQYPVLSAANWTSSTTHSAEVIAQCGSRCGLVVQQIASDALGFPVPTGGPAIAIASPPPAPTPATSSTPPADVKSKPDVIMTF